MPGSAIALSQVVLVKFEIFRECVWMSSAAVVTFLENIISAAAPLRRNAKKSS